MTKRTRRTVSQALAGLVALTAVVWAMRVSGGPVTLPTHIPVVIRHGDTAWALCQSLGHIGDMRSCASGHGNLFPGTRVVFTVRKEVK
jgi:hypothetical protein